MSCWVGGYIEAGMGTGGSSGTPYLPFAFCGPATKADAEKQAGAKLLAGPFATQQDAQNWATAYERNPNTLHAGTDIPAGPGQPVHGGGSGPGGTGSSRGDTPPAPLSGLAAIGDFFSRLAEGSTWIRLAEGALGLLLIAVGIAKMTNSVPIASKVAAALG